MNDNIIVSTTSFDPFNENKESPASATSMVHLRLQQRNARQKITTVQGLSPLLDFNRILKVLKKKLCCNANIIDDEDHGKIMQFQGDHRREISEFIIEEELVTSREMVKIHGAL